MTTPRNVIVLTGVTRGLGRALLPLFAQAGHTVLGCGRSEAQIQKLNSEFGSPHQFTALDVREETAVIDWAETMIEQHGPPDLLINNAAVMNTPAPLWEIASKEFDFLMDVNIKGVVNVIRGFVPAMVQRQHGVIVNLSSGWGRSTAPQVAPYCATKYAIEGLTLALAQELPAGMAAVPLNPGIIDTDMLRQCFGEGASSYPTAELWARRAAPMLMELSYRDNGRSLSVL